MPFLVGVAKIIKSLYYQMIFAIIIIKNYPLFSFDVSLKGDAKVEVFALFANVFSNLFPKLLDLRIKNCKIHLTFS